jgi:hypothetical protein
MVKSVQVKSPPKTKKAKVKATNDPSQSGIGNTSGPILLQVNTNKAGGSTTIPVIAETEDEKNFVEEYQEKLQQGIDDWVEKKKYSTSAKILGSLATALNQTLPPTSVWELIPAVKGFKLVKKGKDAVSGTKKADKVDAKKKTKDKEDANSAAADGGGGVNGPKSGCIVGKYKDIKDRCPEGQQAHHIIPDTLNRTSTRKQGAKGIGRIPGMPSLADGPSICLQGHAKTAGSEHNVGHEGDRAIRDAAKRTDNGPIGTLPVSEAVPIAMQSAINAKPQCKAEIEAEVKKAYPNHDKDNRSMNGEGRPPSDKAKAHLDSGGNAGNQGSKGTAGRKKK